MDQTLLRPAILLLGIFLVFLMALTPVSSAPSSFPRHRNYDVEGYYDREGQLMDPRREALLQMLADIQNRELLDYPAENVFGSAINKRRVCLGDPGCRAQMAALVRGQKTGITLVGRRRRDALETLPTERRRICMGGPACKLRDLEAAVRQSTGNRLVGRRRRDASETFPSDRR